MSDQNNTPDILDRIGRKSGMTVPDGYFEQFADRMKNSLPEVPWETEARMADTHIMPSRSLWQRVSPYVYMAAMFAGIWLMMNISTLLGTGGNVPAATTTAAIPTVAELIDEGESEFTEYAVDNFDRIDLYDDLYASGFNPVSLSYND